MLDMALSMVSVIFFFAVFAAIWIEGPFRLNTPPASCVAFPLIITNQTKLCRRFKE
jgi:hypothetical protein